MFSWEWRERDKFFEKHFRPGKDTTTYQRFDFPLLILVLHAALSISYKHPAIFFRILSAASIADSGLTVDTLPPVLAPAAMSDAPDKYL